MDPERAPGSSLYLLPRRPSPGGGPSPAWSARSRSARPALRQAGRHEPVEAPLPPSSALSPRHRRFPATPAAPRTDSLGGRCRDDRSGRRCSVSHFERPASAH